jgi:hypothetical protein
MYLGPNFVLFYDFPFAATSNCIDRGELSDHRTVQQYLSTASLFASLLLINACKNGTKVNYLLKYLEITPLSVAFGARQRVGTRPARPFLLTHAAPAIWQNQQFQTTLLYMIRQQTS